MSLSKYQKSLNEARENCDFYHHGVCVAIDHKKRMPCFCLKFNRENMEVPRRIQLDKMTPAERAIYEAGLIIEKMEPDERLTNAQIKLHEARELVADFVDSKG